MKERPILFSGPMVRAILDGRKTQTRRVIKPPKGMSPENAGCDFGCPYGVVRDRLWVLEAFCPNGCLHHPKETIYRADVWNDRVHGPTETDRWGPSIHMPRWASRVTLEVVGLRVERIQDISEEDARAEGVADTPRVEGVAACRRLFGELWDSINAKRGFSWKKNPWVWVVEFRRVDE